MNSYVYLRAFPRPEPSQVGWMQQIPAITWTPQLQAGIRKGADRVWDRAVLDVTKVDKQQTGWLASQIWNVPNNIALRAGVRQGADRVWDRATFDVTKLDRPQSGWIFTSVPAVFAGPFGIRNAGELVGDRVRLDVRTVGLANPAPIFPRLPWNIFFSNRGDLVAAQPVLDVRQDRPPVPAWIFKNLPVAVTSRLIYIPTFRPRRR